MENNPNRNPFLRDYDETQLIAKIQVAIRKFYDRKPRFYKDEETFQCAMANFIYKCLKEDK